MTTRAALELSVVSAMAAADAPMRWGEDDCALWVANALRDPLGYDPAAKVRGRYRTRRGAMRTTGRAGLLGQLRAIARARHWKRIDPRLAQAGDVGMAWTTGPSGKPVLATVMCRARGWFVGRNEMGFSAVAADRVAVAWSVLPDALAAGPGPRVNLRGATHDPISQAIGLTALITSVIGESITIGAATISAAAIGGAIVSTSLSRGVSFT